ncbi:hypothetical protein ASPACDRAFT_63222 [Aspergillus aculeatus ATCC 16872]|uniref:Uncharacterized protein n=1 Tax=Aspergillus aculeatus (strain ATCC 16872 / CBS 172.66 / WB 5094) TaxID=690307 RepID=A0A1L9WL67_ASPA1|nr:uncharacterized protein ASPACDRAFT_63222 [Aspergillus aculeatus ATCC 16872]OJJ96904.1 hypothetical protein ASPACDRAFT_63222 [Aspergillus aculeatus ATCC 16872]
MCYFGIKTTLLDRWESVELLDDPHHNSEGENLLMLASKANHLHICQMLVKLQFLIGYRSPAGNALMSAATYGHRDLVEFFLQQNISPNLAHSDAVDKVHPLRGTALASAAQMGKRERTVRQRTGYAARCGRLEVAQLLLDKGAAVNQPGGIRASPLHDAAYGGDPLLVRLLLEKGATVNGPEGPLGSELMYAMYSGRLDVAQLLLDKGAAIDQEGGRYGSALSCAVRKKMPVMVEFLLSRGATIDMPLPGSFGSALDHAVYADRLSIAEILIDHGANVELSLSTEFGSALARAAFLGHLHMVQFLVEEGALIDVPLRSGLFGSSLAAAAAGGDVQILKYLVNEGARANRALVTARHRTALYAAVYWGHVECVKALLDAGAAVDFGLDDPVFEKPKEIPLVQIELDYHNMVTEEWLRSAPWGDRNESQMAEDKQEIMRLLVERQGNVLYSEPSVALRYSVSLSSKLYADHNSQTVDVLVSSTHTA